MNVLLSFTFFALATIMFPQSAQERYFPKGVFSASATEDQYWASRYHNHLKSLHEPSLYELSKAGPSQSYRFLWLRTFHHPVSVRFGVGNNGVATITLKMTSGTGGQPAGHVILNRTKHLTKQETDWFLGQIDTLGFWGLATREEPFVGGPDGAQWIVEGAKEGKYHLADRWSPKNGAVRSLGLALAIDLGHLDIPAADIY